MDGVEYLTVRDTLVIYAEFTRVSPVKTASVLSMDGLESALAQPRQSFDGNDLYPTMPEKAAALLYSLCANHPFADGNERLAFMATRVFLRRNGLDLSVGTQEAKEVMYAVATGDMSAKKVADWIADRLGEYDG